MPFGNQGEYAKHRGCSPNTVTEAIKKGRLKKSLRRVGKRWKIDFEKADQEWERNTQKHIRYTEPAAELPDLPDDGQDDPLASDHIDYQTARTQNELHKARLAKLEYLKRRGDLVELSKIRKAVFDILRVQRDRLLASPPRLAHAALAAESEAAAILAVKAELNVVLKDTNDALDAAFPAQD